MFARIKKALKIGGIIAIPLTLGAAASYNYLFSQQKINQWKQKLDREQKEQMRKAQKEKFSKVDQPWNIDPIFQPNSKNKDRSESGKEMSDQDKKKNVVFTFMKTNDQFINQQVRTMAQQFVDRYFENIAEKFQFIFEDIFADYGPNSITLFAEKDGNALDLDLEQIINRDKSKQFKPNYQKVFKQMLSILGSTPQISAQNINEFVQQISCQNQGIAPIRLITASYNSTSYSKDYTKGLISFMAQFYGLNNVPGFSVAITCDQLTNTILGLNKVQQSQRSSYHFLTPLNRNVINLEQHQIIKINGKKFALLNAPAAHHKMIFSPVPPSPPKDGIIIYVNIDLNKAKSNELDHLYSQLAKQPLMGMFKAITHQNSKNPIEIFVKDKRSLRQLKDAWKFPTGRREKQMQNLLSHSYEWKYPHEQIKAEKIINFFNEVKQSIAKNQNSPHEYFRSQQSSDRKFSVPLVGEQVKQTILKNSSFKSDSVVFHYSKNCHSCNKFKRYYEQIALQNFNINFYRIDNDTNKINGMKSYNSTPIFAMYKHQLPLVPWYYKMPYFTKPLFENFVKIVSQIKPIDAAMVQKNIKMHEQSKNVMNQLLKDVQNYQIIQKKAKIQEPIKRQIATVAQKKIEAPSQDIAEHIETNNHTDTALQEKHQARSSESEKITVSQQHLLGELKHNSKAAQL